MNRNRSYSASDFEISLSYPQAFTLADPHFRHCQRSFVHQKSLLRRDNLLPACDASAISKQQRFLVQKSPLLHPDASLLTADHLRHSALSVDHSLTTRSLFDKVTLCNLRQVRSNYQAARPNRRPDFLSTRAIFCCLEDFSATEEPLLLASLRQQSTRFSSRSSVYYISTRLHSSQTFSDSTTSFRLQSVH